MSFLTFFHASFYSYNIILEMDAQVVIQDRLNEDSDLLVEGVLIEEVKTFFRFFFSVNCTYTLPKKNVHILIGNVIR